ncbi:crotonase/enoyl-CoA hydratase family protein [Smaragdicoccus niigatensis]|uniref:crotonase/enoyl-CoA hydratase family protein n=1 Tax=Smaragdicoccus niigatensis TaxID=359359 RepID=UPI00036950D6|nr:crotonase/enoyl-CoA hydratase family protein [Smaragdicoccus niigatensis]
MTPKPIRVLRGQLRSAQQFVEAVRRDPRILREIGAELIGRKQVGPTQAAAAGPPELDTFDRQTRASMHLDAGPEAVAAFVSDLARLPDWLTVHAGFRGEPPAAAYPGLEFIQQAKLMGIPADVAWTVVSAGDTGVEMRGRGPMGLTLGFWLVVEPDGPGSSTLSVFVGLAGQPVQGPLGASLLRSFTESLEESLHRLAAAVASLQGAKTPSRKPVLHEVTGTMLAPNTPVLVGVGQVVDRVPDPARDPAAMAASALRLAARDCGAGDALLRSADAVYAVASASWQYRDLGAAVAAVLGTTPSETVQSVPFGGDAGQVLVNEAAESVATGKHRIVLVTGAEAGATLASHPGLSWPGQPPTVRPTRVVGLDKQGNNDSETAVGLGAPIYLFALMDSANRRRLGLSPREHAKANAELWSTFSAIAAQNPHAWQPEQFHADSLLDVSGGNRMITSPYTKLLCANLQVDMASGVIVCSAAAAQEAGIPQDKWVFIHAGASAHDEWFATERAELAASPAIRTIGQSALDHARLTIDEIDEVDLYSCFPSAVQISARELGLPINDPSRPLSVTGGLTFGGGPGNNFGGHSIATMVERLRSRPKSYGLTTSLGWYLTKHSIGVYSAKPPAKPYQYLKPFVDHPPSRPVRTGYRGSAVIEAYTVPYGRDGEPEAAIVSAIAPDGARVLVRVKAPEFISELIEEDVLGLPVTVDGDTVTITSRDRTDLPAPPPPSVLVERRGSIMVITLNRPAVRNAVNLAMATALERAIDSFEADPDAQVAILTGAGGYFSAGMDLKAAARGEVPMTERRGPLGLAGRPPRKPLIAAVEGPALAGGCELALSADLIVAASDSQFGIPEPKRGLVAAGGGVYRLRERLPRNIAMQLALTGDPMSAAVLASYGLVNEVTEPGQALAGALRLAEQIAVNAPLSLLASKQIIDETSDWSTAEAFARQNDIASEALFSADATEGIMAFAEKRAPVWTSR